jgi:hypothetical protein
LSTAQLATPLCVAAADFSPEAALEYLDKSADSMCGKIESDGYVITASGEAGLKAILSNILKYFADFGINLNAKGEITYYDNALPAQLTEITKVRSDCRLVVFEGLKQILINVTTDPAHDGISIGSLKECRKVHQNRVSKDHSGELPTGNISWRDGNRSLVGESDTRSIDRGFFVCSLSPESGPIQGLQIRANRISFERKDGRGRGGAFGFIVYPETEDVPTSYADGYGGYSCIKVYTKFLSDPAYFSLDDYVLDCRFSEPQNSVTIAAVVGGSWYTSFERASYDGISIEIFPAVAN